MGFVGNYAPRGLSPQTDGMPVIPKKAASLQAAFFFPVGRNNKNRIKS